MRIERHPLGVWVREDGAIYLPQSGTHKARWTFGSTRKKGYRSVMVNRKHYSVHRLVAETFHGPCPPDKPEIDHIDRNPANNREDNLRYADRSMNCINRGCVDRCTAKYGASPTGDRKAYNRAYARAYRANSPEARERQRTRNKRYYEAHREEICAQKRRQYAARYAEMKAAGFVKRKGPDGKQRWVKAQVNNNKLPTGVVK